MTLDEEVSLSGALAIVAGKPFTSAPKDLFIPPDALEVLLDSFSGPLDLLLYLIRRQNLDILDIPMAQITDQYMQYIALMQSKRMALAADYLVMAAMLIEIKSRLLLPTRTDLESEASEEDPRLALVRRLQAYEQFKQAAQDLETLPRCERDTFPVENRFHSKSEKSLPPEVDLKALISAMTSVLKRQTHHHCHQISREVLSVRDRINSILSYLQAEQMYHFSSCFQVSEGRRGLVVTFLALLELNRQSLIRLIQANPFAPIYFKAETHER